MKSHLVVLFGSLFLLGSVLPTQASAATAKDDGKVNVHGFVDGGWFNNSSNSNSQGFLVRDGALYIDKSLAGGSVMIDLPFGSTDSGTTQSFGWNSLNIKGQAFVRYQYDNGIFWKLGKWDKFFGVEANDTVDVRFTQQGLLYQYFIPRTTTGLSAGYRFGDFLEIQLYSGFTNGTLDGASGVSTVTDTTRYDFGGQAGLRNDDIQLLVGYRTKKDVTANAMEGLLDVIGGYKLGALHVNLGFDFANYAQAAKKSSFGMLGMVAYDISSALAAGVRAEYVTSLNGADGGKGLLLTVGPQYNMNENIRFKADYSFQSITASTGLDAVKSHIIAADVVYAL